jgi:hypothetical protein
MLPEENHFRLLKRRTGLDFDRKLPLHNGDGIRLIEVGRRPNQNNMSLLAIILMAASFGPSNHQVALNWKPSDTPNVTYTIVRNKLKIASGIKLTTYNDAEVQPGKTYGYQVFAVGPTGLMSKPTAEVKVKIPQ